MVIILVTGVVTPTYTLNAQEGSSTEAEIYVVDMRALTYWEKTMFTSLQGIANREDKRIYLIFKESEEMWLEWYEDYYGLNTTYLDDPYELFEKKSWPIKGYTIMDLEVPDTVNIATNYASTEDLLPVTEHLLQSKNLPALQVKHDLRGDFQGMSKAEIYDWAIENQWPNAAHDTVASLNVPFSPAIDITEHTKDHDTIYLRFEDSTTNDGLGAQLGSLMVTKGNELVAKIATNTEEELTHLVEEVDTQINDRGKRFANQEAYWTYKIDGVQGADLLSLDIMNQYKVSIANEIDGNYEQLVRETLTGGAVGYTNEVRDYVVAHRGFFFELSSNVNHTEEYALRGKLIEELDKDGVVLGWHPARSSEKEDLKQASEHGKRTLAASRTPNFSLHQFITPKEPFKQPQKVTAEEVEVEPNKIYVTFVLSDGDSLNFVSDFQGAQWNMDGRGEIPFGWEIQPLMEDMAPGMLEYFYQNATENDTFVASASGLGYTFPDVMKEQDIAQLLEDTKPYLERLDLTSLTFLPFQEGAHEDIAQIYGDILGDSLNGVVNDYWGQINALSRQQVVNGMAWMPTALPIISKFEQRTVSGMTDALNDIANQQSGESVTFVPIHVPKGHMDINMIWDVVNNLDSNTFIVTAPDEFMISYQKAVDAGLVDTGNQAEVPIYDAQKTTEAITVDGDLDAVWEQAESITYNGFDKVTSQFGNVWDDVSFESDSRVMWDENNLYYFARVEDSDRQIPFGSDKIYKNDAVGLYLYDESKAINYKLFATPIGRDGSGPLMAGWGTMNNAPTNLPENAQIAGKSTDGYYTVEVAIPWSDLRNGSVLVNGDNMKFSLMTFDADENSWGQSMWVGQGDTPSLFADLHLVNEPVISPTISIDGVEDGKSYTESVTPVVSAEVGSIDISEFTTESDSIYVKFEDSVKEDGFGAQVGNIKVSKDDETVLEFATGSSAEGNVIYKDNGSRINDRGRRYVNKDATWIYKLSDIAQADSLWMDLTNQYTISAATEADGPYNVMAVNKTTRFNSGIKEMLVRVDNEAWTAGTPITGVGSHTIVVEAISNAGHKAWKSIEFVIKEADKKAPEITTMLNGQVLETDATVLDTDEISFEWEVTDEESGVAAVTAMFDGEAYKAEDTIKLAGKTGKHELIVTAEDHAGNVNEHTYAIYVTTNAEAMRSLLQGFVESGAIDRPNKAKPLDNQLRLVQHFGEKESVDKAVKHLELFKKKLEKEKQKQAISEAAYQMLMSDANYLKDSLQSD